MYTLICNLLANSQTDKYLDKIKLRSREMEEKTVSMVVRFWLADIKWFLEIHKQLSLQAQGKNEMHIWSLQSLFWAEPPGYRGRWILKVKKTIPNHSRWF